MSAPPQHNFGCKVLHSLRRSPCFPNENDSLTLRQKAFIQAQAKPPIDPPCLTRQEKGLSEEDLRQIFGGPDVKEEARHNGVCRCAGNQSAT
jgi:hypothetical protein